MIAVVAAGLALLSGCSAGNRSLESSSASADPPASAPASTSASAPSPTVYVPTSEKAPAQNVPVPMMPEAAKQQTKEGWEAFAKYYIDELNYMVETNDPSRVEALASGACDFCRVEIHFTNFVAEQNQWPVDGVYSLHDMDALMALDREGNIGGNLKFSRQDYALASDRGVLGTGKGIEPSVWYLQLTPVNSGWKVFQFGPAS
nr:DUF6318 family protein [Haematomicrobium sanguinis]